MLRSAGHRLKTSSLARLAVEKLSVDHLMPAEGLAGGAVVMKALRRKNVEASTATEMLLIDLLSRYAAYALAAALALLYLWWKHDLTRILVVLVTAVAALIVGTLATTVSFIPGGVGSFEAGCTATLALAGVPLEAAITGTLLLRGFTLWVPLLPGFLLVRGELAHRSTHIVHKN